MTIEEITTYIHNHIPLTVAVGAQVDFYDGNKVIISAPLAANLNHRQTAFGGSISTLAILSGWTLLFLKLREEKINCRLVIQKSTYEFREPIESDFRAICEAPSAEKWGPFLKAIQKRGRGRITVKSIIESASGMAGHHTGVYVAALRQEQAG